MVGLCSLLLFNLRPTYGGDNEDNGNLFQQVPCTHCCTQCPRPWRRPRPTHTWTLLHTHRQVWVSLLWSHCSFLLGPDMHKVLFVPFKSLFPSPVSVLEPKQKQHPVVDVTGDWSKVWWCKGQYCIGTWNVRSISQGKLEVVKQEMARVNTDILGIREQKWTGMVNLTQMTIISTTVGKNPLEEM